MKLARILRILLLLVVIFAAGLVTGRLTAPRPPTLMLMADGRIATSETMLTRLEQQLHLTPEQERQFRALFEEAAREMSRFAAATPERMEAFKRFVPRMEALLQPEQRADFDRYVRDTERRYERLLRTRTQSGEAKP